jgi:hypothetical protein
VAEANQRNLISKAFIADIAAEEENDTERVSGNSLRPMTCGPKQFMPFLTRI